MRILVTGGSGKLGCYLLRELTATDEVIAWTHTAAGQLFGCELEPIDLTSDDLIKSAFQRARPDVVIHTAAITAIADCFQNAQLAHAVNVVASSLLAKLAEQSGARLMLVSTDMVFDGQRGSYQESDTASPVSVYGHTKLAAEQAVLSAGAHAVVRVSWMFGRALFRRRSFFDTMLEKTRQGESLPLFEDEWRTPLSLRTAAAELSRLAHDFRAGTFHLGGPERMSRYEMGRRLVDLLGGDPRTVIASRRSDVDFDEPRPADLSLDSTHWRQTFPESRFASWEEEAAVE